MGTLSLFESLIKLIAQLYLCAVFLYGFAAVSFGLEIFETEMGKNGLIALVVGFFIIIVFSLLLKGARVAINDLSKDGE